MTALDVSYVNRAAPPGSLRYFSLLYAPPDKRTAVAALYVLDSELREAVRSAAHELAHARLQWWQEEVERLADGTAQHPAMRILAQAEGITAGLPRLRELLAGAAMDLARLTYSTEEELQSYCAASGGALYESIAARLCAPSALDEALRELAQRLGSGIRMTEILRDLPQDAWDGRIYLPLQQLDRHGIAYERLRAPHIDAPARELLKEVAARARAGLQGAASTAAASSSEHNTAALRVLRVLAVLHERLLDRIAARSYDVASRRIELGPIEKPWLAWRAARRRR